MKNRVLLMIVVLLSMPFLHSCAQEVSNFDLEKLLIHVFDPQPGEKVVLVVDHPHGGLTENPTWADRRDMAGEWQAAFQRLAAERDFEVLPLLSYPATGAHNKPLPETGDMDGKEVSLDQIFASANIAVVMTEYSATATMIKFTERYPNLRVASMPMVSRSMQETAMSADYSELAHKCKILWEKLDRANGAKLEFSTGHQLYVDLRERGAELDDGQLHAEKQGARVINLPSGEAYIAPYEGEKPGQLSRTQGELPLIMNEKMLTLQILGNRVVSVQGEGGAADEMGSWFDVDPARTNIAELGLGCNDKAVITGNILEDEKVLGVHLASGRSDHIGGTIGIADFNDLAHVVHRDVVYPQGGDIQVLRLVFEYEDGSSEEIIQHGKFTVFGDKLTISTSEAYFIWLFLVAVSLNYLAWDLSRRMPANGVVKLAWALVIMTLGPIGLLVYLRSYGNLRQKKETADRLRVLGASVIRAALFALWLVVLLVVFVIFLPEPGPIHILSLTYLLPIVISLFAIGAPYEATRTGSGYWSGVRRVWLTEFVIQTITFVGLFPTFFYLDQRWLPVTTDLTNPLFWFILSISNLMGAIILYPFIYCLTSRGFRTWSLWLVEGEDIIDEQDIVDMSLRHVWGLLLLSIILFAGSIGLIVVSMS